MEMGTADLPQGLEEGIGCRVPILYREQLASGYLQRHAELFEYIPGHLHGFCSALFTIKAAQRSTMLVQWAKHKEEWRQRSTECCE